jgi:outer membrane protein OmpA-like peptidoglycan-associated protein
MAFAACAYTIKIKDGRTAFEQKQYAVATKLLPTEISKAKTRTEKGRLAFLLAESYRELHQDVKAQTWYKTALENGSSVDAMRELAYCLKRLENFKEAVEAFKNLGLEIGSPYEYRREITACHVAQGWIDDQKYAGYAVEPLNFNTASAEYAPSVLADGKIVLTSDRNTATGEAAYGWTGNRFSDLFIADNNQATRLEGLDKQLNTPFNEATASFTADDGEMYFTKSGGEDADVQHTKIFYSRKISGTWTTPEVLPFCKEKVNYSTPSVSKDGKTLYFAANDPEGWGGYDLYEVKRGTEGFVEPKIIGRSLNTIGNEAYPSLDGDTLYFASDYHTGLGGYDIFKTYKLKDGSWANPLNMKPPINSGADDFSFVIDYQSVRKDGIFQQGYFTSNRMGGKGNDDIYKFERSTPPPRPVVVKPEPPKKPTEIVYKNLLDVIVLEKVFQIADNPNSKVLGRRPLADAKVTINIGGRKREMTVNTEGVVSIELEANSDYSFLATRSGYLNNATKFSSKGLGKDPENPIQKFEVEIVLDKIYTNKEITLENIYYDYDKWDIRADAQPTLNKLAETLEQNPSVKIQLSSHTDCRGKDEYNANLSQKRAESAVNYLISKGISPERLGAKGYGESQPSISCDCTKCSEDQHQANRRTTFKVLEN